MKTYFILSAVILSITNLYGQHPDSTIQKNKGQTVQPTATSSVASTPALFIIIADGKRLQLIDSVSTIKSGVPPLVDKLHAEWIESIDIVKDKVVALEKYGPLAKNGVIVIGLKKGSLKNLPAEMSEKFQDF